MRSTNAFELAATETLSTILWIEVISFSQAEDGIRYLTVTGVQTCALPILCYHQELANLVFSGSFIYDVLCGFFYFAALTYYVRIREQGVALRAGQLAIFLALYLCALNSKEMAVSLPVIVFIYEVLKYPRIHDWKQFALRNWSVAASPLVLRPLTEHFLY